jgi:hypothetical protein
MAELIIFAIFGGVLALAVIIAAVAYKIETGSKKSIWRIMSEDM